MSRRVLAVCVVVLLAVTAGCDSIPSSLGTNPIDGAPKIDLRLTSSRSSDSIAIGATVTFTLTATNLGPGSATGVTAGDTLTAGFTYVSSSASAGTSYSPQTRLWTIGSLPVNSPRTLTITAVANSGTGQTWQKNNAGILANEADSVLGNNFRIDSVRIQGAAGPPPPPAPPPPPPPPPGPDEPTDPGSGYLWQDNFDRYDTPQAMQSCQPNLYGVHTVPNHNNCNDPVQAKFQLTTGRSGTGKALRSVYAPDPQHNQQSLAWLSPYYGSVNFGTSVVMQFWIRVGVGQSYAPNGGKFWEVWWTSGPSGRIQWGNDGTNFAAVLGANPGGSVNRTVQAVGPRWNNINDGNWHRVTLLFKPNTSSTYFRTGGTSSATEVYTGTSSRDGRVAMWIDGTRVLDYAQGNVGVTPPGGSGPWCRQGDVDMIPGLTGTHIIGGIRQFQFPEVANGTDGGMTIDHDDLKVWRGD